MSVSRRLAIVGFSMLAFMPRAVDAEPILLPPASGFGSFSAAGSFLGDDDVAFLTFSFTGADALVRAETTSYRADLGFDPFLALFDATGTIVQFLDPDLGDFRHATAEDIDFEAGNWDALLALSLTPGAYTLALMQYPNIYTGADGTTLDSFALDGDPFFTQLFANEATTAGCTGFIDFNGTCRTGNFALTLTVTPVETAPIPEPGTLSLLMLGSAAAAALRRRRQRAPRS